MITQADIGSSQQVKSPKYLVGAHQTRARADTANKNNNNAIFDDLNNVFVCWERTDIIQITNITF